jgi:hypothetical protein
MMSIPTHKRRFRSSSNISIDDMIDWSDEEPMEEEENLVPHLLGSLSNMDSFGLESDVRVSPAAGVSLCGNEDDPLSRRDSVFNPSPLVLSVRKIYPDEEASIESSTNTQAHKDPSVPQRVRAHTWSPFQQSQQQEQQQQPLRKVSDFSENMAVDTTEATSLPRRRLPRQRSHRRVNASSLPAPRDLDDVLMNLRVTT